MSDLNTQVRALFDDYGRISDQALTDPQAADFDRLADAFAEHFVGSAPQGVFAGTNDDKLREVIPQGFAHYRKVGGKRMLLQGLQITPLDELHAVAAVDWEFAYENKAGKAGTIRFTNFYFVTIASGEPKIFAYVTADEQKAMKDHGLA
jgi:hypothetical protein